MDTTICNAPVCTWLVDGASPGLNNSVDGRQEGVRPRAWEEVGEMLKLASKVMFRVVGIVQAS